MVRDGELLRVGGDGHAELPDLGGVRGGEQQDLGVPWAPPAPEDTSWAHVMGCLRSRKDCKNEMPSNSWRRINWWCLHHAGA